MATHLLPTPRLFLRASTLAYLGVMVVLPLAALTVQALRAGRLGVLARRWSTPSPGMP